MTDTDQERFAGLVADHVVSAVEQMIGERLEPEERHHRAIAELMREMLAAMPTTSGWVLAEACNRYLSGRPYQGVRAAASRGRQHGRWIRGNGPGDVTGYRLHPAGERLQGTLGERVPVKTVCPTITAIADLVAGVPPLFLPACSSS